MTYCKDCKQEAYCRQLKRCIEHEPALHEDMEVMRRYGEAAQQVAEKKPDPEL